MLATETANWKKVETLLDNISTSDVRYLFLLVVFILSLSFRFFFVCVVYALSAPFKSICRSLVFLSFFLNDMCFTYRIHLYLGPVHTLFTCTRIFLKPLFISFESVLCPHENNESAQPNRSCLKQLLKVFFLFFGSDGFANSLWQLIPYLWIGSV